MGYTIRNAGYIGKAWVTGEVAKDEGGILNTDLARFMPSPTDSLYAFTSYTFTNCGSTGYLGPSEANCDTAYAGQVWLTDYFSVSGGIQKWTVPKTGSYTFAVRGASGGSGYGIVGGKPRLVQGTVNLNKSDIIEMAIGQRGDNSFGGSCGDAGGGGAGGTFVYNETTSTLLFAAGGGGGGARTDNSKRDAPNSTSGNNGSGLGTGAPGGTGGGGGATSPDETYGCVQGGGGGGGYDGDGYGVYHSEHAPGEGFLQGAKGGNGHEADGGFGGGGSSGFWQGGGGGGYSGGGGGGLWPNDCWCSSVSSGGGGGSYVISSATSESSTSYNSSTAFGSCSITLN